MSHTATAGAALVAFGLGIFTGLGCVQVPERVTVYAPDRTPLAVVDTAKGEIVLSPQAWILLNQMGRRR